MAAAATASLDFGVQHLRQDTELPCLIFDTYWP
jgi:hypothetical protein